MGRGLVAIGLSGLPAPLVAQDERRSPTPGTRSGDYGVLWIEDRLVYDIDRRPVSDIRVPVGFVESMYLIGMYMIVMNMSVNLAIGSKDFPGVGPVDADPPGRVASEIEFPPARSMEIRVETTLRASDVA